MDTRVWSMKMSIIHRPYSTTSHQSHRDCQLNSSRLMSSGKIIIPIIAVITQLHKCHITTCNFEIVASMRSNPFFVCLCLPLGPFPGERDARGFTLSAWRRPFNEQSTVDSSMKKSTYRKTNLALARWISKTIHSIRSTTIWSRFVCTHRSIQSEQDKKKACAVLISSLQLHFYFFFLFSCARFCFFYVLGRTGFCNTRRQWARIFQWNYL